LGFAGLFENSSGFIAVFCPGRLLFAVPAFHLGKNTLLGYTFGGMFLKSTIWSLILSFALILVAAVGVVAFRWKVNSDQVLAYKEQRDFDRLTHVNTLASAVREYMTEYNGKQPGLISNEPKYICRSDLFDNCEDLVDLRPLLSSFIIAIPSDPTAEVGPNTHYLIEIEDGKVVVSAPEAETEEILATR